MYSVARFHTIPGFMNKEGVLCFHVYLHFYLALAEQNLSQEEGLVWQIVFILCYVYIATSCLPSFNMCEHSVNIYTFMSVVVLVGLRPKV